MKKALFALSVLVFLSKISIAQSNFVEAYYVNNKRDTVRGSIDYKIRGRVFSGFMFREVKEKQPFKIRVEDARALVVNGSEYYERRSVRNEKTAIYGLFKVITRGDVSLLEFESRYFAQKFDGELMEISAVGDDGQLNAAKNYAGMGILLAMMGDCKSITPAFLKKEYDGYPNFIRIFKVYAACNQTEVVHEKKIRVRAKIDFGIQLSPGPTFYQYDYKPLYVAKFNPKVTVPFGAYISFFIPRLDDKVRIVLEAEYSYFKSHYFFTDVSTVYDNVSASYSFLRTPFILRYEPNHFFFDVGFQSQFTLSQSFYGEQSKTNNGVPIYTPLTFPKANSYVGTYLVGIGANYKLGGRKIRNSVRYFQTRLTSSNKETMTYIYLTASVQLTK